MVTGDKDGLQRTQGTLTGVRERLQGSGVRGQGMVTGFRDGDRGQGTVTGVRGW